jgi:hypothetical protein
MSRCPTFRRLGAGCEEIWRANFEPRMTRIFADSRKDRIDRLQNTSKRRLQGVKEFITSELPGKPLFRVKELTVTSLQSLAIS